MFDFSRFLHDFLVKMLVYMILFLYLCIVKRTKNDIYGHIRTLDKNAAGTAPAATRGQQFAGRVKPATYKQD
jgi:hypothetical protein